MIQVRANVFETNSSSMHSIAITKGNNDKITSLEEAIAEDKEMVMEDGVLKIKNENELCFGWGFKIVDTAYGKIKYAIASYCNKSDDKTIDGIEKIMDAVNKVFPEIKEIDFPTAQYSGEITCGYIDHESFGTLNSFLNGYDITLEDFIADRKIIVIIDNDNSCHFSRILYSGIFNKNAFADDSIIKRYHDYYGD